MGWVVNKKFGNMLVETIQFGNELVVNKKKCDVPYKTRYVSVT